MTLLHSIREALYAVWPQVHVRTATTAPRLDALLWIRNKKSSDWIDLEVDGAGHNPDNDKYRDEHLAMPTIRFSQYEVNRLRVAQLFVQRAQERLAKVPAGWDDVGEWRRWRPCSPISEGAWGQSDQSLKTEGGLNCLPS